MRSFHHRYHCAATFISLASALLAGSGVIAADTIVQEQIEIPVGVFSGGEAVWDDDDRMARHARQRVDGPPGSDDGIEPRNGLRRLLHQKVTDPVRLLITPLR